MLLKRTNFTIFDFETTGLYPYSGDKICEIGAIRIGPRETRKKFHSMVNPQRPISKGAFFVNRITPDMLISAPGIHEVLPKFIRFIKGSVLVAYNAGFDVGFLECALGEDKNMLDDYYIIDALILARRLFPGIGRYNLSNVAESIGVRSAQEHRALYDAYMTAEVFQKELEILMRDGVKTVEDIANTRPKKLAPLKTMKNYKITLIESAIREQKKLNIIYRSSWKNEVTQRTITPKELQQGYDRSYLVAYCHLKNGDRNFRLDGIVKVKPEDT